MLFHSHNVWTARYNLTLKSSNASVSYSFFCRNEYCLLDERSLHPRFPEHSCFLGEYEYLTHVLLSFLTDSKGNTCSIQPREFGPKWEADMT